MKKLRNFLLGMDLLFVCILAGKFAENSMLQMVDGKAKTVSDASARDLDKKKVALTFDDGPNINYTEMLLDGQIGRAHV